MTRDTWGDTTKGLLIVLVVFWHVVMKSYLQIDWHLGLPIPGVWGLAGDVIWPFLMPLFLLVSGVYAANALRRPWAVVLRTRVVRFLYLYLFWSLIHAAAMWAFPEFPTLVPRSVADFVESVTISPPNTWYLYALALYFVLAKALVRLPPWTVIAAAAALSVVVSAGYVEIVSNRGSLLYNLVFFLLGAHLGPHIRRLVPRSTLPVAAALVAVYGVAFAAMRLTHSQEVPGVWPVVSLLGVAMGLAVFPLSARVRLVGPTLLHLGRRSLPIYLVHMPLLAVVDGAVHGWISSGRPAVQLVAAVAYPVVLTTVLVGACLVIARLADRDRVGWLFDLPWQRRTEQHTERRTEQPTERPSERRTSTGGRMHLRAPWRLAIAVGLVTVGSVSATSATAVSGCPAAVPRTGAEHPGQVSIGAVGDVLMHDVEHGVPSDGGRGHFDAVRSWFTQDLVTGNLEQVVSADTGVDKCDGRRDCLAFRSEPATAAHLAGFDLMNLANNHTGDFGPTGYSNTEAALAAQGIASVGRTDQMSCRAVGGTRVATIGFSPYAGTNRVTDLRHVRKLVAAASRTADVVVVHAHMGAEGPDANVVRAGRESMFGEDRGDPRAFAHVAVDAGADLLIGHGPHSLRGTEFHRGRLIAYSLGNFGGGGVFGAEQATRYGAYLDVTLRSDGRFVDGRLRSVTFDQAGGRPVPDASGGAAALVDRFGQRDFGARAPTVDADGAIGRPRGAD